METGRNMSVRFGILSTAKIAKTGTIPAMRAAAGAEPMAVASRDRDKAQVFADECGLDRAYGSYEELLADPEIDAIYVAVPIHMHKEWTLKALAAGKAVLCEKALCLHVADAIEMYSVAQQKKKLLKEVMAYHHHPLLAQVQSLIADGAIGAVRVVHAAFHTPTFDTNNIRMRPECGGGALRDLGVYCIDACRQLSPGEPLSIKGSSIMGETGVDVLSNGILQFEESVAYFACSLGTTFDCHFTITGTNGHIRNRRGAMCAWGGEEFIIELNSGGDESELTVEAVNPYQKMIESFVDDYHNGVLYDPQDNNSVGNLKMIEGFLASL